MILTSKEFVVRAYADVTFHVTNPLLDVIRAFAGAPGSKLNVNWPLFTSELPMGIRRVVFGGVEIKIVAKVMSVGGLFAGMRAEASVE